jgi:hypothetical protein
MYLHRTQPELFTKIPSLHKGPYDVDKESTSTIFSSLKRKSLKWFRWNCAFLEVVPCEDYTISLSCVKREDQHNNIIIIHSTRYVGVHVQCYVTQQAEWHSLQMSSSVFLAFISCHDIQMNENMKMNMVFLKKLMFMSLKISQTRLNKLTPSLSYEPLTQY